MTRDEKKWERFKKEDDKYVEREMRRREKEDAKESRMSSEQWKKVMEERNDRIERHREKMDKKYRFDK